jgi:hypothetical protein
VAASIGGQSVGEILEGDRRFTNPAEIQSVGMMIVAVIGLVINLISMKILSASAEGSLNIKGASDNKAKLWVIKAATTSTIKKVVVKPKATINFLLFSSVTTAWL